jgi:hypothetical protein
MKRVVVDDEDEYEEGDNNIADYAEDGEITLPGSNIVTGS